MDKTKVQDFLLAVKDDGLNAIIENDNLPTFVTDILGMAVSESTASLLGAAVGAIAPRVNGVVLNFKERRFERNVSNAVSILCNRIDYLDAKFEALNEGMKSKFKTTYLEWLLDNLYVEQQQEKIPCHVNGYINFMDNETNDNIMLMFFNTLQQLTKLDIDVLNLYNQGSNENIFSLKEKYNLDTIQVKIIKEKLVRLGLLESKNDAIRDDNIDKVVLYMQKLSSELKKSKPKDVKIPNLKKTSNSETYSISSLGRGYLLHMQ